MIEKELVHNVLYINPTSGIFHLPTEDTSILCGKMDLQMTDLSKDKASGQNQPTLWALGSRLKLNKKSKIWASGWFQIMLFGRKYVVMYHFFL